MLAHTSFNSAAFAEACLPPSEADCVSFARDRGVVGRSKWPGSIKVSSIQRCVWWHCSFRVSKAVLSKKSAEIIAVLPESMGSKTCRCSREDQALSGKTDSLALTYSAVSSQGLSLRRLFRLASRNTVAACVAVKPLPRHCSKSCAS